MIGANSRLEYRQHLKKRPPIYGGLNNQKLLSTLRPEFFSYIVEAKIEQIRSAGGNPFLQYQVPEAILKFRQGVGRLIRSREDRGIVVILDPRVTSKSYGRWFLKALPDCRVRIVDRGLSSLTRRSAHNPQSTVDNANGDREHDFV